MRGIIVLGSEQTADDDVDDVAGGALASFPFHRFPRPPSITQIRAMLANFPQKSGQKSQHLRLIRKLSAHALSPMETIELQSKIHRFKVDVYCEHDLCGNLYVRFAKSNNIFRL